MIFQCLTTEPVKDERLILEDEFDENGEGVIKKKRKKKDPLGPDGEEDPDVEEDDLDEDLDEEDEEETDDEEPEINLDFIFKILQKLFPYQL